jgi:homoserine O-succinyltransferase
MKHRYQIDRQPLSAKMWGVFNHRIADTRHPLLRDMNTRFDVPHSRHNAITREQFEQAGLTILMESPEAGVHMVVSKDQFRYVYLQGHPEYDINSLLKEYKREVLRFLNDERDIPPYPANYFVQEVIDIVENYLTMATRAKRLGHALPQFPEKQILPYLDNTWGDSGKSLFNNWLGLVYQLTHVNRHMLFVDGVDPDNPLNLL